MTHPPIGEVGFLVCMPGWLVSIHAGQADRFKSADGEEANAQVCKTCIRGFKSRSALHIS